MTRLPTTPLRKSVGDPACELGSGGGVWSGGGVPSSLIAEQKFVTRSNTATPSMDDLFT